MIALNTFQVPCSLTRRRNSKESGTRLLKIVRSVADMSRRVALLSAALRSFRSISFVKTGNTLGNTIETVRPPPEDMADSETLTATFAMS